MAGVGEIADLLRDGDAASATQLKSHVDRFLQSGNMSGIREIIQRAVSDEVNLGMARDITSHVAEKLKSLSAPVLKEICQPILDLLQQRLHSFEAQANQIRDTYASVYFEEDDYGQAARILEVIRTDGQSSVLSVEGKMELNVRIAQMYLEINDHIKAETFINRATRLASQVKNNKNLILQYKACHVRVADKKRKYVVAAQRYYQLSLESVVEFGERMTSLQCALNCAVLAQAGPIRARLLAMLYKDDRSKNLIFFDLLERMYLGQIVRKEQIKAFEEQLDDHHKALLQDGVTTVLDRAMTEHNIVAASKIYRNISFTELGTLLGIRPEKAEQMTAGMISEERMQGRIDQLSGFVHFGGFDVLTSWNDRIRVICIEANEIAERCQRQLNPAAA